MTKGQHDTLATRRKKQIAMLQRDGRDETQPADMLELYLLGESVPDIAKAYGCSKGTVYKAICKEALYRLMEQRAVERLEELEELEKR